MKQKKYDLTVNDIDFIIFRDDSTWGDGEHESTQYMFKLISKYGVKDKIVMDIGTGTGILSVLCGKLGAKNIQAIDIDPYAIKQAKENLEYNNISNAEVISGDVTRFVDGTAEMLLANLPLTSQIKNLQNVCKNMTNESLLIMTWWNQTSMEEYMDKFEVVEHIPGKEYDGYVLKLKQN